ncbi:hypothetical protein EYB26_005397 [Talaromyces marneffei]|nr:uncharacterized protein EYB26_005397 [Talaromyces marneffei]QGA17721.1 hypothetical protein EYB26_005397 [Talaromyces marneffei]
MEGVKMTGMAHTVVPTAQTVLPKLFIQITNQIDFAPTAPGKKSTLRSWERQPSTPFLARHKSRKIWKRFRKSMEAIRSRTVPSAAPSRIEESEYVNEISQSANAAYLRAVKRQRVLHAHTERGGSFLETKWELEIGRRKRKLVGHTGDEQFVANGQEDENEADGNITDQLLEEIPQSVGMSAAADSGDDEDTDQSAVISEIVDFAVDAQGGRVAAEVRELIAKKEPNLVRSALRMNSLDGEDAALLSEFLSRAQAKRAANAAMAGDNKSHARQKKEERQALSSPAVQSRRALEELDVNSPSIKPSTSTPVKAEKVPESPESPDAEGPTDIDQLTSSPTVARRRRSSRTKPTEQTRSLRPVVPNNIPVRRANGTEFVFLQRTEAQELALTTRKNTRRNKGNALLPRYLLQAIVKQERNDETTQPFAQMEGKSEPRQSRKHATGRKQVCWNEDKLVEYAPETGSSPATESPSPDKKKSSSSRREEHKSTSVTTHALPATPSKKVRRINMATSSTSMDDTARAISKPMPVGTPIPKRKKLTPRPKSTTTAAKTVEFRSGHSSRDTLPSAAAKTATKQMAPPAQHTASKMSGIPRSKALSKPSAPSTSTSTSSSGPIVKRVRARRAV